MRSLLPSALLAAVVMALLPAMPQPAHAEAGVLRCAMPDSSHVYTSKACSAFGATSALLPGEVPNRIERDRRHQAALTGATLPTQQARVGLPATPALRAIGGGCATSPQQLAMDLQAAVAIGDVNRVAESYHWNGMDNAAAQRIMSRLQLLASRTMLSAEYFDARMGGPGSGFANAGALAAEGDAGTLRASVSAEGGSQLLAFPVQRYQSCYCIRY